MSLKSEYLHWVEQEENVDMFVTETQNTLNTL